MPDPSGISASNPGIGQGLMESHANVLGASIGNIILVGDEEASLGTKN